ncbi:hypothetical protein ACOSQ2_017164 [Xanthoceras sorbifolium]|uniref:PPC domain-containing protein n=1 Tax=Xanthoceras sorbifolium TaxID=99658 RepID=A0ABQ8HI37_9ROSI|nr:hypothetical protein JRO89_XS10G0086500 [Xanthoceras sorbifolium]
MADYSGATISLSQTLHTSDSSDDSSDNSPRSVPTLATPKSGSASASTSSSKLKTTSTSNNNKITAIDYQHPIMQSTAENSTRKPRGRPPGSKNKPKPAIVITRDSDSLMKPVILQISAGADIIDNIISFARRNHAGISVMSATGSVSGVTLRHPAAHVPSMSLHGPFQLISLSGTYLGPSPNNLTSPNTSFGVTLTGAQGHVFGGTVAGKMTAGSQVVVAASTFVNPSIHRLPIGDHHHHHHDNKAEDAVSGGFAGGASDQSCSSVGMPIMPLYGGAGLVANPTPLNCQMPADVMHWAPRPPY